MSTKLILNPENQNLADFRKQMMLTNVAVYPDMLVYSLPTKKIAEGCIPMAMELINRSGLPLTAERPQSIGNTFIVKPEIYVPKVLERVIQFDEDIENRCTISEFIDANQNDESVTPLTSEDLNNVMSLQIGQITNLFPFTIKRIS